MTNYERIKNMSKDEMVGLLGDLIIGNIEKIDNPVCKYCKQHHNSRCSYSDRCCYPDDYDAVSLWLDLEATP